MRAAILVLLASCAFAQTPIVGVGSFDAGLPLTGASFPRISVSAAASGDVDIYTAPNGKRVLVTAMGGLNAGGNSVTWFPELKVGSTYYRLASSITTLSGAASTSVIVAIILEPGESISVNTTASGINLSVGAIQFDATSPLKTVKLVGTAAGTQTMYTVPTGKTALLSSSTGPVWNGGTTVSVTAMTVALTSAPMCIVASGGAATCAANSTGEFVVHSTGANTRNNSSVTGISMNSGDMFVVNVTGNDSLQLIWANVLEL